MLALTSAPFRRFIAFLNEVWDFGRRNRPPPALNTSIRPHPQDTYPRAPRRSQHTHQRTSLCAHLSITPMRLHLPGFRRTRHPSSPSAVLTSTIPIAHISAYKLVGPTNVNPSDFKSLASAVDSTDRVGS